MQNQMILSVMSKDRSGIIAKVTGAIFDLNGDLADLSQSLLGGYFTMILIATFPDDVTPQAVEEKLAPFVEETGAEVIVKQVNPPVELSQTPLPEKTYIVTAQAKNRGGLVYGISSFCFEHDINILDLTTTLSENQYTMILQLDLTRATSIPEVRADLDAYAQKAGLQVVMQHYDIFRATNEVTLV